MASRHLKYRKIKISCSGFGNHSRKTPFETLFVSI